MEATKDHISLETAKLLEGCMVVSKFAYFKNPQNGRHFPVRVLSKHPSFEDKKNYICPAYTWQEILWEYPFMFLRDEVDTVYILEYLQNSEYKEADLYFRGKCIEFLKSQK